MNKTKFMTIEEIKELGNGYRLTEEEYVNLKTNTCLTANSIESFCDDAMVVLEDLASRVNLTREICLALIKKAGLLSMENYKGVYNFKFVNDLKSLNELLDYKYDEREYVTYHDVFNGEIIIKDICRYTNEEQDKYMGKFQHDIIFMIPSDKNEYLR